jgi:hypothetical protein
VDDITADLIESTQTNENQGRREESRESRRNETIAFATLRAFWRVPPDTMRRKGGGGKGSLSVASCQQLSAKLPPSRPLKNHDQKSYYKEVLGYTHSVP